MRSKSCGGAWTGSRSWSVAGSVAKTDWCVRRSWGRALYAATPTIWLITRFCARTSLIGHPLKVAFTEHVHSFIALDGPLHRGKRPTPQPRIHAAFLQSMILFYEIIQTVKALTTVL
jgi:hypothetical protein